MENPKEKHKQETLEEVAKNYTNGGNTYCTEKSFVEQAFIEGAKWMQEKNV